MILTPDQNDFLSNIKKDDSVQQGSKRALIKDKMYLWPNAKVYYNFDKGVGKGMKRLPHTITSVCIFSIQFSKHFPRCR